MEYEGFTPEEKRLATEQLDIIAYTAQHADEHVIAGRWAVFGITGTERPTKNVDVMVHEAHAKNLCDVFMRYAKDNNKGLNIEETKTNLRNLKAKVDDVVIDAIILYSQCYHGEYDKPDTEENKRGDEEMCNTEYVIFETPYHTPFRSIPLSYLHGVNVGVRGVNFSALNPEALCMAKMTTTEKLTWELLQLPRKKINARLKRNAARDLEDIKLLRRFVDAKQLKDMKKFA